MGMAEKGEAQKAQVISHYPKSGKKIFMKSRRSQNFGFD
jgi:hypothetical protein